MPDLKTHCSDCLQELGKGFSYVHEWLDEFFKYTGPDHRGYRHNQKGIEEVKRKWGDKAAGAAEIHIKMDEKG